MFGLLPEIHKPQVWVDRASVAAAEEVLAKYEQGRQHECGEGAGEHADSGGVRGVRQAARLHRGPRGCD